MEPLSEDEEDIQLMLRMREGDLDAFSILFHRHRKWVEQFLYRLFWRREKAEDGTQEVFMRLWSARAGYRPCARFTTFLYQVARNYWRDEMRKAQVRPVEVDLDAGDDSGAIRRELRAPFSAEPQERLFEKYRQWRIRQAISRLPEPYRIVFVLAHFEDRRISEIAAILEIPEGTVKSRLHTAARRLRDWLMCEEKTGMW